MYLFTPPIVFSEPVGTQSVTIADIPAMKFGLAKAEVDKDTGELKEFELTEPVYQPASELSDDVPLAGWRVGIPLPAYPTDLKEATAALIVSTQDLALDLWLQTSRANMTHLCPETPKPNKPKRVKPLYKVELGVYLRYKIKIDREIWTRTKDPKTNRYSHWAKDRVEEGKLQARSQGVFWGDRATLNQLIEATPCIDPVPGEPRDMWVVRSHAIYRTFSLPYLPAPTP